MALKAQHAFEGMDTDTTDRFLPEGSYRNALNVHIGSSEDSNMFSVENIKGNSLVSYSLPSGTNQVIGSHEDIVNKVVYYFLCNTSSVSILSTGAAFISTTTNHGLNSSDLVDISGIVGRSDISGKWIVIPTASNVLQLANPLTYLDPASQTITLAGSSGQTGTITTYKHSILKYDSIANTISLVYRHSRLNFNAEYPIAGTALIGGILHWTDSYNPPRSLNIAEAANYGTFFIEAMVDFIRIPPTKAPLVASRWVNRAGTDVPYLSHKKQPNSLNRKVYQFIYRYVYFDDSRSVYSPISEAVPTGYPKDLKNRIDVTISNDEISYTAFYSLVIKSIEIAFRDSPISDFKYIDRIPFSSAYNPTLAFDNKSAYSSIESTEANHYFETIPLVAGSLAAVQNRIFMGDSTEGFDVDPTDFSATNIVYSGTAPRNSIKFKEDTSYELAIEFFDRAERRSGAYKLCKITMPEQTLTTSEIAPRFTLTGTPPIWATHFRILRSSNLEKSYFIQGFALITKKEAGNTFFIFNPLAKITYSPQAGDKLIISYPNADGEVYKVLRLDIDDFENTLIVVEGDLPILNDMYKVEIYTPSKANSTLFYETPERFPIYNPGSAIRSFFPVGELDNTIKLDLYDSGDVYKRNLNGSVVYHSRATINVKQTLTIVAPILLAIVINGDLYQYIPSIVGTTVTPEIDTANYFVNRINNAGKLYKAFLVFTGERLGGKDSLVKFIVYDTRVGALGSINVIDVTSVGAGLNKTGVFSTNKISGAQAEQFYNTYGLVEAMSCNDINTEWDSNIGRATAVLADGNKQTRRGELVRFGGKNIVGTALNNIHSFYSLDQEQLGNSGNTRKLIAAANNQSEGTVLLAVQDNDISSLYIGQVVLKNASGGQNVAATDKVIGTANSLQKTVGTVNPESVVQNNGTVYGFDALRGIVWRYGQDGLTFISEETGGGKPAGMKAFFYNASKYLLSQASFKCYAGIDPYSNEYVLTIPGTDVEQKTIVWSERMNRWTSYMSFIGEWYQRINTRFISFKSGQLWLHQDNALFNNFYGVQYTSKLKFLCNKEPFDSKILQVIEQTTVDSQWDCIDISTPLGQSSELLGLYDINSPSTLPADFTRYENRLSANVMRDKNTPNMSASDYPLLTGDEIRSDVFTISMKNDKTVQQNLFGVSTYYVPSSKTM
jgi:hypothetical protein